MADAPHPTLHVDALAIALPAGFEGRAARIGRLTAEALAASPPAPRNGSIGRLRVAPLQLFAHWNDRRIAFELAGAIRRRIDSGA